MKRGTSWDERSRRKDQHLAFALKQDDDYEATGFNQLTLIPNALPEVEEREIQLETTFLGSTLRLPILINAITGGSHEGEKVNRLLAIAAREHNVSLAVGSQKAALEDANWLSSFRVARKENPHGVILANVSAGTSWEDAARAVDMIQADGLQVHLNAAQEMAMAEGERDFRGWEKNLSQMVKHIPVPVIAKEVGFGLSKEVSSRIAQLGVKWLDVGGRGGSNFAVIEHQRQDLKDVAFEKWGLGTVYSMLEAKTGASECSLIASGGIRHGLDIVKAFALGASLVGIAKPMLVAVRQADPIEAISGLILRMEQEIRRSLVLTGCKNIREANNLPVVYSPLLASWIAQRKLRG